MGIEGGPVGSVGGLLRRCCARGPTGWQPSPSTISLTHALSRGAKEISGAAFVCSWLSCLVGPTDCVPSRHRPSLEEGASARGQYRRHGHIVPPLLHACHLLLPPPTP